VGAAWDPSPALWQNGFSTGFVINPVGSATGLGLTLTLQNDPRATAAIGGAGSTLGTDGANSIQNSVSLQFLVGSAGLTVGLGSNGSAFNLGQQTLASYNPADPLQVVVTYNPNGTTVNGISETLRVVSGDTLLMANDSFDLQGQPEIHVSYVYCSNASIQAEAVGASNVVWSINTPTATSTSNINPTTFVSGSIGYTSLSAQVDTLTNTSYTDFIYIGCASQTTEYTETICSGGSVLFNNQTYTQTGDYTATFTNAQGCDSISILHLVVETINNTVSINPGNGQELLSSNTNGLSYQWMNCTSGAMLPGANGPSLLVAQNGTYAVISTNANGCSDTSNCVTINYIGLDEASSAPFSVFPNPVVSDLTLQFAAPFTGSVYITDMAGKRIYFKSVEGETTVSAILDAPQGVYLVHAADEFGVETVRVVKR